MESWMGGSVERILHMVLEYYKKAGIYGISIINVRKNALDVIETTRGWGLRVGKCRAVT